MPSNSERPVPRARVTPPSLRLSNWPLRDEPLPSWALIAALCAASLAAGFMARSVMMGLLILILLLFASWRLWVPVTFELGSKGVIQSVPGRRRRIPWSEFARYEIREKGVLLSPDPESEMFTGIRSLFIRSPEPSEELLALLDFYLYSRPNNNQGTTRTSVKTNSNGGQPPNR